MIGLCGLFFEVMHVRLADSTADSLQMKFDVGCSRFAQRPQQKTSHFGPSRTAQSSPLPDFTDRVASLVAVPNHLSDPGLQSFVDS